MDFGIVYNKQAASPGEMYKVIPRAAGNSEKLPKDLEAQVVDLYDPKNLSLFGTVVADDGPLAEADDGAAPAASANGKKKKDEVDDWMSAPLTKKKTAAKSGRR